MADDALPPTRNYTCYRGDAWARKVWFLVDDDEDPDTDPVPVEGLEDITWLMQVRKTVDATDILATCTFDTSALVTDGLLILKMTGAQTTALPGGKKLVYDLQASTDDEGPRTVQRGTITSTKDVSRPEGP